MNFAVDCCAVPPGEGVKSASQPPPAVAAASQGAVTTSPWRSTPATGRHTVQIAGLSQLRGLRAGRFVRSATFVVGRYDWCVHYCHDGDGYISVFLELETARAPSGDSDCQIVRSEDGGLCLAILTDNTLDMHKRDIRHDGVDRWVLSKSIDLQRITRFSAEERGKMMIHGYDDEGHVIFLGTRAVFDEHGNVNYLGKEAGVFMVDLELMVFRNLGLSDFIPNGFYCPYRNFYISQDELKYEARYRQKLAAVIVFILGCSK
ncbi:hypothetical protein ACP4OV_026991 [Aristida adscensionis]